MSSFAPVYQPPAKHQSFLTREQKRARKATKRKREAGHSDDSDSDQSAEREWKDEAEASPPRVRFHPVNKTDPYHVAGLSREDSPPAGNFPHAPLRQTKEKPAIEQELAKLNPPLYLPKAELVDKQDGSLKRRHLDNLTAILHKCMLSGDWERASRAWGLILRTEVQGRGIDVRHNGRWMVGAELLMRRNQVVDGRHVRPDTSSRAGSDGNGHSSEGDATTLPYISDQGFQLAKDYYERLILQYPHMPRLSHAAVNALAIYPALFNVWVYEVYDRASRAQRRAMELLEESEVDNTSVSGQSESSVGSERKRDLRRIKRLELEQATAIAQRMDGLMLNPPYDTSPDLLHLRSMICLWLFDLHKSVAAAHTATLNGTASEDEDSMGPIDFQGSRSSKQRHDAAAKSEIIAARRLMLRMADLKMEIPGQLRDFLEDDKDDSSIAQGTDDDG